MLDSALEVVIRPSWSTVIWLVSILIMLDSALEVFLCQGGWWIGWRVSILIMLDSALEAELVPLSTKTGAWFQS